MSEHVSLDLLMLVRAATVVLALATLLAAAAIGCFATRLAARLRAPRRTPDRHRRPWHVDHA
jgi:hypothetical protein